MGCSSVGEMPTAFAPVSCAHPLATFQLPRRFALLGYARAPSTGVATPPERPGAALEHGVGRRNAATLRLGKLCTTPYGRTARRERQQGKRLQIGVSSAQR